MQKEKPLPPARSDTRAQRGRAPLQLLRAVRLVWRSAPALTFWSAVLTFAQGILPLATLYLMKLVMDAAANGVAAEDKEAAFAELLTVVGLAAGVALVGALLRNVSSLVSEAHSRSVADHMLDVIHERSVAVDLEYYENPSYHDTLHRAQAEAPHRPTKIVGGLVGSAQSALSITAMAGLLVMFHWAIALVVIAAAVPAALVRMKFAGHLHQWQRQRTSVERASGYFSRLLTRPDHAKEVRLFDLGRRFAERFRNLRTQLRQERLAIARRRSVASMAVQTLSVAAMFGSYGFVAYEAIQGTITLGDLVMYSQAIQRGQGYVQDLLAGLASLYEDNLFLTNLFEFLDLEPRITAPARPDAVPRPMQQGITFEDVTFSYPTGRCPVLTGVDLHIRPGEHIALVGLNGAGKTTLFKLLCRLHDPTAGRIAIDGIDLRQFDPLKLRKQISAIFQDYARYDLTARENIALGDVEAAEQTPGRVEEAAQHAGVHDLVASLPRGFDTVLGNWFEGGNQLSIGEWQKIALARAFVRNAQIMILDEPTSALDPKAEAEVIERFRSLVRDRTAILVSHRFSTVMMADRICLLEDGRIAEIGTHDELIRAAGTYARLFEHQARHFRP